MRIDNGNGRGVYLVVNEGGQKADSITRIRAVFADFDPPKTAAMPEHLPLEPHIVVESSPGHFHAYWLVDGLPVDEFKRTQQAIAAALGSDPAICDLPRVMRLPGFVHHKGDPFATRIIHESGALPYTADAIRAAFPAAQAQAKPGTSGAGAIREGQRDSTLASLAGTMRRRGMTESEIFAALRVVNQGRCSPPLMEAQVEKIAHSVSRYEPEQRPQGVTPRIKDERRGLRFVPTSEFLKAPTPPNWVIDGIAETDSFCVLFGDPQSGKSFMAMDWACCVATGSDWKGRRVKQGPVLYINGEGHNGINRRLTAWAIANGVDLRQHPLFRSSTTTALTSEVARAELEAVVADFIHDHGKPVLIVIDTLARNFGDGDENSTQDMVRAVATVDSIREMTGAWVVVVHHSGQADKTRARGSIVLRGAADTEYRMGRVIPDGDAMLENTKIKDGAKPNPATFRFADVELGVQDEHGRTVTSAVLIQTNHAPMAPPTKAGRGGNQTKAMKILGELQDKHGGAVLLDTWRIACIDGGIDRNRFHEVRRTLVAGNLVVVSGAYVEGTPS